MSVRFDANTDRMSYLAGSPPNPSAGITISGWAYISADTNANAVFIRMHSNDGGTTALNFATDADGIGGPGYFTISGSLTASTNMVVGQWRKVAITRIGTTGHLYVATPDGVTEVDTGTVGGAAPTGLTFGARAHNNGDESLNGRLAYWRIWSAVLSQAEIEAEWDSATPVRTANLWADWPLEVHTDLTDHSGNGRNLVAGTTATTTEDGPPISEVNEGVLDASLPALTAALAGHAGATATLGAELPAMAAGLSAEAIASAALLGGLPALQAAMVAEAAVAGELTALLPAMGAALTGAVETEDNFFVVLPAFEAGLVGEANSSGTLAGTLPALTAGLTGSGAGAGILTATLPAMEAELSGIAGELEGELIITLPRLMMMSGRALRVMKEMERQRKVTREFIMASPTYLALIPKAEVRTASGGVVLGSGVARPVQVFRKIPMSHTERPNDAASGIAGTGGGVQRKYDMTLLAEWDAVVRENDTWIDEDGQQYIVDALVPFNGYQVKALVMSYGRWAKTYG